MANVAQTDSDEIAGFPDKIRKMFSSIAPRYDLANTVLSLGIHHLWKRELVSRLDYLKAVKDSYVLDLCTGTGDVLELIAQKGINCIGVDFCREMLEQGASRSVNGAKLNLMEADAVNLPFKENTFDAVTIAFGIRNIPEIGTALNEITRVLKPKGRLLILEFGRMQFPVIGPAYNFYADRFMPLIGGILTGNRSAYSYLPQTSRNFPSRENFNRLLETAGFEVTPYQALSMGIGYIYQAAKRS